MIANPRTPTLFQEQTEGAMKVHVGFILKLSRFPIHPESNIRFPLFRLQTVLGLKSMPWAHSSVGQSGGLINLFGISTRSRLNMSTHDISARCKKLHSSRSVQPCPKLTNQVPPEPPPKIWRKGAL